MDTSRMHDGPPCTVASQMLRVFALTVAVATRVADSFTRPCPALLTATAPAPARSSSAAASRPKPAASSSAAPASAYPQAPPAHAQPAQAAAPASSGGWFSRPAAPPPAPSGTLSRAHGSGPGSGMCLASSILHMDVLRPCNCQGFGRPSCM